MVRERLNGASVPKLWSSDSWRESPEENPGSLAFGTVLLCPHLSHLTSSLIVPCPVPNVGWARGLFRFPPALLSLPTLVTPTAIAPHWLTLFPTWELVGVWAGSKAPHIPRLASGPASGPHPLGGTGDLDGRKAPCSEAVVWGISVGDGTHVVFYPKRFFLPL